MAIKNYFEGEELKHKKMIAFLNLLQALGFQARYVRCIMGNSSQAPFVACTSDEIILVDKPKFVSMKSQYRSYAIDRVTDARVAKEAWGKTSITFTLDCITEISIDITAMEGEGEKMCRYIKDLFKPKAEALNAEVFALYLHVYGLPVPDGAVCNVFLCPNKYIFSRRGQDFNLDFSKVIDVSIKTEVENFVNYTNNLRRAAIGYAIGGSIGAAICAKTEKKIDQIEHRFLIFAYLKDAQTIDFISFDCTGSDKAWLYVEAFTKTPKVAESIDW